jgi:hypothetical protein
LVSNFTLGDRRKWKGNDKKSLKKAKKSVKKVKNSSKTEVNPNSKFFELDDFGYTNARGHQKNKFNYETPETMVEK